MYVLVVCSGCCDFVWYISLVLFMIARIDVREGWSAGAKDKRANQSHLMQLQKIKIAQPTNSLTIAALKLTVMMVTMEMTLMVVLCHLPHKKQLMSNPSLPSRLTNSHTAPRIMIMTVWHRQEFPHIWWMFQLIVLAPLLNGLIMSLSLPHINITSQTFRVSRLSLDLWVDWAWIL
jgi:hypothetical protein